MSKFIVFFLINALMFGQNQNEMSLDSTITEKILVNDNIGVLGYQFQQGKFYNVRISDGWRLQTGLFHTNSDNYTVVQLPFLIKHDLTKNFRAFLGSKLEVVIDPGFSTLRPLSNGGKSLGASADFGLEYDVSKRMMFEVRYSLPIIEQSLLYPSTPDLNAGGMLFFGSGFKF